MRRLARTAFVCLGLTWTAWAAGTSTQPAVIDIENPPKGVFSDEWYALMLNNAKCGHMHNSFERVHRSGKDIIRSKTSMTITVGRADTRISISLDQSSEETLEGRPLGFKHTMLLGRIPSNTVGKIANGKVTISTTQFGMSMGEKTYDLPEGAIMSWGTYREQIRRGLKPGLKYELPIYEPTMSPDRLTRTAMEVFAPEEIDLFGRKVQAYRTRQTAYIKSPLGGQSSVETVAWMTDAGTVVRLQMSVPPVDMPFDVIACPKSAALAPNEPAELMMETLISVAEPIDRSAKRITCRLILRPQKGSEDEPVELPRTAMQKIVERQGDMVTLQLTRRSARRAEAATRPAAGLSAEKPGESYLQPTADLNFKDPVVADLARKAVGKEKDPNKMAERLVSFVHEYVQSKNLSIGFATASEVARSKEGDCSEHGVLLAALGRAVGIPARIVTGVVYAENFEGRQNVFVGHLWTQFWLDNEWTDVDAAFGQTDVDPTHIALGVSAGETGAIADLATSGWLSMSGMKIKVLRADQ